jgi:hypothetical protein
MCIFFMNHGTLAAHNEHTLNPTNTCTQLYSMGTSKRLRRQILDIGEVTTNHSLSKDMSPNIERIA